MYFILSCNGITVGQIKGACVDFEQLHRWALNEGMRLVADMGFAVGYTAPGNVKIVFSRKFEMAELLIDVLR